MHIIIVAAISKDFFITRNNNPDPRNWTSDEDKDHFRVLLQKHSLQVMGRKTYGVHQPQPSSDILIVILTRTPNEYSNRFVVNQLEFDNLTPKKFVERYEKEYPSCLVLGGSYVYTSFLEAGLIDEIYLTVEPVMHSCGIPFLQNDKTIKHFNFPDPEISTLNSHGTMLLHYVLKK